MRKIVLTSPSDTHDLARVSALLATAEEYGFTVVTNAVINAPEEAATTLASHFNNDASRQYVTESGIAELNDVAALSALEAWRLFGGLPVLTDNGQKRGRGQTFTVLCRLMVTNGIGFSDIDPVAFAQYSKHAWEKAGATRRIAAALEGVELFDVRILVELTDKDIEGLNYGEAYRADMTALRDQLKRTMQ